MPRLLAAQGPDDSCWPSQADWKRLNASVSGRLIADTPIAISCYPGPDFDKQQCASVDAQWNDQAFQALNPIGLSYPDDSCPPVSGSIPGPIGNCSIGTSPRYTVNATQPSDVVKAIQFAKKRRIRLVIKNTGHDLLLRSVHSLCLPGQY